MPTKPRLNEDEAGILILLAAILFGSWFRLMPAWLAGFPVNDGGMFYTMILDLQTNHYAPPLFTTYNNASIPFAYPPLGFYIGAGISDLFNIAPLAIIRWLPGIINTLCIPAFYLLAKEILNNKFHSSIAALIFAMTPRLTSWLSMGGGLTRSLGTLFLIFTILFSYKLLAKNEKRAIWGTIFFGSMTVLSHTESTVFAIGLPIYIWLVKSRSFKGILHGGLVAFGVLLLAGPWYGLIIYRHGFETLLSALQTGGQNVWSIIKLINIDLLTEEPYLDLLGVFGVLGIIALVVKKQYFLPGMFVAIYFLQPRSAATIGNIPASMAAGMFVTGVLLPAIRQLNEAAPRRGIRVLLAILIPYFFFNSTYQGYMLSKHHVTQEEQVAMQWVKDHTPNDSHFLVLTGEPDGMCDSSTEWFPALTKRTSLSTVQGREWLLGNKFLEFYWHKADIQGCIDEGMECLEQKSSYFGTGFDYIYVSIQTPTMNCDYVDQSIRKTRGLVTALENTTEYSVVYRSEQAVLLKRK
ncbi:hypothetical protein ANAEL_01015 [Anaerolineales bacterium]|nr:hypothetical protein ANAEL_01015 [Anaerolineales bacterium]